MNNLIGFMAMALPFVVIWKAGRILGRAIGQLSRSVYARGRH